MYKISVLFFCFLAYSSIYAQSFSNPESVEVDYANNRYLVSNRGSVKSIQAVVPGQAPTLFTANVSSPAGLEILGNKLWVCDGGNIKGFDLSSGALTNTILIGGSFLNGITSDGSTYLFVSDFSTKKIYRINTLTESFNEMVSNTISTPNGLWYDGANNRILFVNWGSNAAIRAVSLADSTMSTVSSTTLGNCDGIAADANGNYFVSAWSTQSIHKFNSSFGAPTAVVTGLANPADICYNITNDTLAVPNAQNNTVTFHFLGTPNVSVLELENDFETMVYPNPATNLVRISGKSISANTTIEIMNLFGQDVEVDFKIEANTILVLSIQKLARGTYFYVLRTDAGISRSSFVIE